MMRDFGYFLKSAPALNRGFLVPKKYLGPYSQDWLHIANTFIENKI
jgi:hypothetical protein